MAMERVSFTLSCPMNSANLCGLRDNSDLGLPEVLRVWLLRVVASWQFCPPPLELTGPFGSVRRWWDFPHPKGLANGGIGIGKLKPRATRAETAPSTAGDTPRSPSGTKAKSRTLSDNSKANLSAVFFPTPDIWDSAVMSFSAKAWPADGPKSGQHGQGLLGTYSRCS